jgi:sulfite reductase alpha subunit
MSWDGKELKITNKWCNKCMHCINVMPKALRPGKDRGAAILIGAKAPILQGAQMSSVLIPFMKLEPPYKELKELIEKIWDFWGEYGKNRERIGELIQRVSIGQFLDAIGVEPKPQMITNPRTNPFIFYEEYFEEEGEENK